MAQDASASSLSALTRFADVAKALRDERLSPLSPAGIVHADFRRAAFEALCPAKLAKWKPQIEAICIVPDSRSSIDLVEEVAKPWSLAIGALVVGTTAAEAERLSVFARAVFEADPRRPATEATTELARNFKDAFEVQAFVALSQTLPCFLANAWLALLQHPEQMRLVHEEPAAVEELLRFAGPSSAVLRYPGPVALMLAEANRDPVQFADPGRLDLRRNPKHLAFGAGEHSCVGASLIRMVATIATKAFIKRFQSAKILEHTPRVHFAIQGPLVLRIGVDPTATRGFR